MVDHDDKSARLDFSVDADGATEGVVHSVVAETKVTGVALNVDEERAQQYSDQHHHDDAAAAEQNHVDEGIEEANQDYIETPEEDDMDTRELSQVESGKPFDIEAPLEEEPSKRSYTNFSHRSVALMLTNAHTTGVLGSGPRERDTREYSFVAMVLASLPWGMLLIQVVWSSIVMGIAYAIGDKSLPKLGTAFWTSRYVVSTSVVYGVGWALFVLLGFFISEAAGRNRSAHSCWSRVMHYSRQLARHFIQAYPPGTWHDGDQDRLMAHLVAFPIALKMSLRGEREAAQLASILHPDDLHDVLNADSMHQQCTRVVRSYHIVAEDDAKWSFDAARAQKTPAGWGTRFLLIDIIDALEMAAGEASKIGQFRPSIGYLNHLRIFMYIWFFFLPISIVPSSGWFTVLFSVLITYGVGMLYEIARALNEPYGFDLQDVKLNRLAAESALVTLNCYAKERLDLKQMVRPERKGPNWLQVEDEPIKTEKDIAPRSKLGAFMKHLRIRPVQASIVVPMLLFIAWVAFVVFLTWGLTRDDERAPGVRWWTIYIPVDSSITDFVGLGIFLLLGFWLNDAYGRYWTGLQIWQTTIRTKVEAVAFQMAMTCRPGLWHPGDRERIFSFFAALPVAVKLHLRDSRDLSEFEDVLATEDIAALSEASDLPQYCLHVLHGYINSADREDEETMESSGKSPLKLRSTVYLLQYTLWSIEGAIEQLEALRKFPLSVSFTNHLMLFTVFWLALLPLTTVLHDGFFSFLFLLPIGYSIIKLLTMGLELADPFGYDRYDIPIDMFCDEIKQSLRYVYQISGKGPNGLVKASEYSRVDFAPSFLHFKKGEAADGAKGAKSVADPRQPTLLGSIRKFLDTAPSVSIVSQSVATIWAVAAVFLSYGLSFSWGDRRKELGCREWCSPVDVNSDVLVNTGFALFMILSFRAYDAIARYEDGAELMYEIERRLRSLGIEFLQNMKPELFHGFDQERIVAHLVQIPLALRDNLLGIERSIPEDKEGLLSSEDYSDMIRTPNQIDHCLRVLEAYILVMDSNDKEYAKVQSERQIPGSLASTMVGRVGQVRGLIYKALGTKRFPVVRSYTKHQSVFTWIWLTLLPLGMAPQTGFFTILWAPLISYGVLALESIAVKLVDPFGTDSIDLPVDKMAREAVTSILEGVHSIQWGCEHHIREGQEAGEAGLGMVIDGTRVREEYSLAFVDKSGESKDVEIEFEGPRQFKEKPSLYAHILRSVPWWILVYVVAYTVGAVVLSYITRRRDVIDVRWWESRISIDGTVASYVSFAPQWITLSAPGTWHEGDHDRIIGIIAAIPIALKLEMRESRDIRELKGLLSECDIGRLQLERSMSTYCLDVVRSYFLALFSSPELLAKPENASFAGRTGFVKLEILAIEKAIGVSEFIREFQIAPGFLNLLGTLLITWFVILPFVLAELSGWWTILWVPLIAYGLLGMYAVAAEIQQPFGLDLNDFDLDAMADSITKDVLDVYRNRRHGVSDLIPDDVDTVAQAWQSDAADSDDTTENTTEKLLEANEGGLLEPRSETSVELKGAKAAKTKENTDSLGYFCEMWRLARHAVPYWVLAGACLWAGFCVLLTWLIRYRNPKEALGCDTWWCSDIAVDGNVKKYVGFALFLLLGFRLYDSHSRYVNALNLWKGGIINFSNLFTSRFFQSNPPNSFHSGDLERIAGYLAAYGIVTISRLRDGEDCEAALLQVLSQADVQRVLCAREKADYCLDVVRAYLVKSDDMYKEGRYPAGCNEKWVYFWYHMMLKDAGAECERIVRMPLPFGYVQHLRIFLLIWLLLLPLGLVEAQGPFTILWTVVIAYGVIGIERWSSELANPFGHDVSDVPLEELKDELIRVIKTNLKTFKHGSKSLIKSDRAAFCAPDKGPL